MKLPPFFEENRLTVDAALERLLPAETAPPSSIHTAMRYSVFAGGKRIRPILCLETARIFAGDVTPALHPACAIEFIHTYSLIHDDLPALDNDDLRRGKPTCHKKFGEAIAILAGDALLTLAFETIGATSAAAERRAAILTEVASAAGTINGMVGGQVADIEAEGKPIDPQMLEYIHRSKTAALIRASITAGALCAGAGSEKMSRACGDSARPSAGLFRSPTTFLTSRSPLPRLVKLRERTWRSKRQPILPCTDSSALTRLPMISPPKPLLNSRHTPAAPRASVRSRNSSCFAALDRSNAL